MQPVNDFTLQQLPQVVILDGLPALRAGHIHVSCSQPGLRMLPNARFAVPSMSAAESHRLQRSRLIAADGARRLVVVKLHP